MNRALSPSMRRSFALAALLTAAGTANAALTVYTSQAAFQAAVGTLGVDTYDDLPKGLGSGTLSRAAGPFNYTARIQDAGGVESLSFRTGSAGDFWLSTDQAGDAIVFGNFSSGLQGIGGLFFGSQFGGDFIAGTTVTLVATDASGATLTEVVNNATTNSFVGFTSDTGLTSLALTGFSGGPSFAFPTANNLTLAAAATPPIPEPSTYATLLAGLGLLGFMVRRRA